MTDRPPRNRRPAEIPGSGDSRGIRRSGEGAAGSRGIRRSGGGGRAAQVVGELLVTLGVLIALFVFYLLYWTGLATGRVQAQATDELRSAWAAEAVQAGAGSAGRGVPTAVAPRPRTAAAAGRIRPSARNGGA